MHRVDLVIVLPRVAEYNGLAIGSEARPVAYSLTLGQLLLVLPIHLDRPELLGAGLSKGINHPPAVRGKDRTARPPPAGVSDVDILPRFQVCFSLEASRLASVVRMPGS